MKKQIVCLVKFYLASWFKHKYGNIPTKWFGSAFFSRYCLCSPHSVNKLSQSVFSKRFYMCRWFCVNWNTSLFMLNVGAIVILIFNFCFVLFILCLILNLAKSTEKADSGSLFLRLLHFRIINDSGASIVNNDIFEQHCGCVWSHRKCFASTINLEIYVCMCVWWIER